MNEDVMYDISDFYVLGIPIETEIGVAHFLTVKDYPIYFFDLQAIGMSKLEIIHKLKEASKNGNADDIIKQLDDLSLFEIVLGIKEIKESYQNIFAKVFHSESVIQKVTADNFEYYRKLIMRMNAIKEEEINPNPEIQRAIERSRRVKSQGKEVLTFSDICSSVVTHTASSYTDLLDYTIYQLYMTFQRIGVMKQYDTSTLFATVSAEVKVDDWSKHINLYEEENHFMTESQFNQTAKSINE